MSKKIKIGNVYIGGGESVKIQSMLSVKAENVGDSERQIAELEAAGCEMIRLAVLDEADARAITRLKLVSRVPLIADIHFSARLAELAVECGADKIRINPGNIGGKAEIKRVADCIKTHKIPVRVGANTGSLNSEFYKKFGRSEQTLVESALDNARILNKYGVDNIVLAVKASSVELTVKSYRLLASKTDYPLHVGVTEAGFGEYALVKSSVGIGSLLLDGIGDTIRVSLSESVINEVKAARQILRACGLLGGFVEVISCPTCGRCRYDCLSLARHVNELVCGVKRDYKIAVMGCVVNGPGEARECDLGIAGGEDKCVIFKKGEVILTVASSIAESRFIEIIKNELNIK